MRRLTEFVLPGKPSADIGTDHALVPIWLLKKEICPFVILSDVRPGPLEKARLNLETAGIDPACYELRLGSGLEVLKEGEVASVIIAGMGGELICSFLGACAWEHKEEKLFLLQPMMNFVRR